MGMFAWVKYEAPCYNCQRILKDWQTKAFYDLGVKTPNDLSVGDVFYTMCDSHVGGCGTWNEYIMERNGNAVLHQRSSLGETDPEIPRHPEGTQCIEIEKMLYGDYRVCVWDEHCNAMLDKEYFCRGYASAVATAREIQKSLFEGLKIYYREIGKYELLG